MPHPKVAVVHPGLGSGGSEAAVLWAIDALKQQYDVTLISMGDVKLDWLNAGYGTSLAPGDFSVRRVPLPWGLRTTSKLASLRGRYLQRYIHRVAGEFDVLISGYGPIDFGKPGVQLIADFSFVDEWRMELHPTFQNRKAWFYGNTVARRAYLALCDRIAAVDPEAWKRNVTLANSAWSANRLQAKFGIESEVLYPPVAVDYPEVSYAQRERGFVCLGRISPEKCTHAVIEILQKVRERGHDVHLHILGELDDSDYAQKVRGLAEKCKGWVYLEGYARGDQKTELLTGHRFGINACPNEAFGIAVAEMVLAGCLVFVPNGGGQVEIVDHPALAFNNEAEAVDKIDAVLQDENEQESLRAHVLKGSKAYSVATFREAIRRVVAEFLAARARN